ncbi:hypothetical protein L1049_016850 [Liquidambar formosana]|uniref:Uncharacterized protein n=1 Tax=Liquidambar formosana TaxID=63359 RepID=A0AAP0S797_LIQFO
MSELKVFLEKEIALLTLSPSCEQLELLVKEGSMLKEMVQKISKNDPEAALCEIMEIDGEVQANKRRKLPDGISQGMELLQSGLKVIGEGISQWQQSGATELRDNFVTHFSRLEDVIAQLVGLAGSG